MTPDFDYRLVPKNYAHCFHGQCALRENCLRYLAGEHCAAAGTRICIINPHCIPPDTATCPLFDKAEPVRFGWGMKGLLNGIPYETAVSIKHYLVGSLGKSSYYRYYHGEYPISVRNQQIIRAIFLKHGIKSEPVYDSYSIAYEFH